LIDRFAAKLPFSERLTGFSNKTFFYFNWIIKLSSVILRRNAEMLNVQERLSPQNLTFSEARKKSGLLSFFVYLYLRFIATSTGDIWLFRYCKIEEK